MGRSKVARIHRPRGCPLWQHATGQWCKDVGGKRRYFGKDLPEALRRYAVMLQSGPERGRERVEPHACTMGLVAEAWLDARRLDRMKGDLGARTFADYEWAVRELKAEFEGRVCEGVLPWEFAEWRRKLEKRLGRFRMNNLVTWTKGLFRWGYESGMLDRPLRTGPEWRTRDGGKVEGLAFTVDECEMLMREAKGRVLCWVLLGLNLGYGNTDVVSLRVEQLDLEGRWVVGSRVKTAAPRVGPLWVATAEALRADIGRRTEGVLWVGRSGTRPLTAMAVVKAFERLLDEAGVERVEGRGFYGLRRTCRTLADESLDPTACDLLMGHRTPGMGARYVQSVDRERVRAVADLIERRLRVSAVLGDTRCPPA